MNTVGIFEAKNQFSRLVALAEDGHETQITRHGRVVARIAPPEVKLTRRILGAQRGMWDVPDGWDEFTEEDRKAWYDGPILFDPDTGEPVDPSELGRPQ
jgi:prevent-host-death family protein